MANRKHVSPDASFSSDSACRIRIIRVGIGVRVVMAETAIGSVGDRTDASAKQTANGMAGIIQWTNKPTPTTVNTTNPSASCRISQWSLNNPSLGMRQPSRNSRGGKNSRKKISGLSSTPTSSAPAIAAPKAICTRGRGNGIGITRTTLPLTTTARRSTSITTIVSTTATHNRPDFNRKTYNAASGTRPSNSGIQCP